MIKMSRKRSILQRSRVNLAQSITLTSSFDHGILDCSICMEPLAPPVYQCINGHVSCTTRCRPLLKDVCPTCKEPLGNIRNLKLEELIDSLKLKCKFREYGCFEVVKFSEKNAHESQCFYRPVKCLVESCEFLGPESEYLSHFGEFHQMKPIEFLYGESFAIDLDPSTGKSYFLLKAVETLFLLHVEEVSPFGILFYVSRFSGCATNSYKIKVAYEMVLHASDEHIPWTTTQRLESITCSSTSESPAKTFLVLPDGPQKVKVKLLIKEPVEYSPTPSALLIADDDI